MSGTVPPRQHRVRMQNPLPRNQQQHSCEKSPGSAWDSSTSLFSVNTLHRVIGTLRRVSGDSRSDDVSHDGDGDSPASHHRVPVRRRHSATVTFWIGVCLAPVASLLLLMGQGVNPLRAAAVLAVLAVTFLGISVALRDNPNAVRSDLCEEIEKLQREVETLRRGVQLTVHRELGRVRDDIDTARTVVHTPATRLGEDTAEQEVLPVSHRAGYGESIVDARTAVYATHTYAPQQQATRSTDDLYPDIQTVEPIREQYRRGRHSA